MHKLLSSLFSLGNLNIYFVPFLFSLFICNICYLFHLLHVIQSVNDVVRLPTFIIIVFQQVFVLIDFLNNFNDLQQLCEFYLNLIFFHLQALCLLMSICYDYYLILCM